MAQLFSLGSIRAKLFFHVVVHSIMKTKILLVVSFITIVLLGGSLVYQVVQKNRVEKNLRRGWDRLVIHDSMQMYQDLDRGDVDKVKVYLTKFAGVTAKSYERQYGRETGTAFASSLAKAIETHDTYQEQTGYGKPR